MTFRRPIISTNDDDLSLNECRYFLFGWGGQAQIDDKRIFYHPSTPIVSQDRICLPSPAQCPGRRASSTSIILPSEMRTPL